MTMDQFPRGEQPLSPEEQFVESTVSEYSRLFHEKEALTPKIRAYAMQQLSEGRRETVVPNTSQSDYEDQGFDDISFLIERLKGRVIDIGPNGIEELKEVDTVTEAFYVDANASNLPNFIQMNVGKEKLPFDDQTFDGIYTRNTVHEEDADRMLNEAWRVLRPGGAMVLEFAYEPDMEKKAAVKTVKFLTSKGVALDHVDLTLGVSQYSHREFPDLRYSFPTIFVSAHK